MWFNLQIYHYLPQQILSLTYNSRENPTNLLHNHTRSAAAYLNWAPETAISEPMEPPTTSTFSPDPKTPSPKLLASSYRRPSSSRTIYGDRFIPSRSSSNFALFNLPNSTSNHDSTSPYNNLLKSALFGPECLQPSTPQKSSSSSRNSINATDFLTSPPNCNIFKYKTETKKPLHSLTPFGFDPHGPTAKAPRELPRSPYKVGN